MFTLFASNYFLCKLGEHRRTEFILRKICSNGSTAVSMPFPADGSTPKQIQEQDSPSFYFINDSCLDNSSLESSKEMLLNQSKFS